MTQELITQLVTLVANLRSPNGGCAWDKKQTHQTLTPYLLEESYEVVEAIATNDIDNLKEELGDVLFQLVLHSQLAQEREDFTFDDVIINVIEKMLRRHPHVFPDGDLASFGKPSNLTPSEIEQQWQLIKKEEVKQKKAEKEARGLHLTNQEGGLLSDISFNSPPLQTALKLQKKAAKVGFDWSDIAPVFDKIREELDELEEAVAEQDQAHIQEELGDMLFAMANLARHLKIDPEQAVNNTNQKFRRRFNRVESLVNEQKKSLNACDLEELDVYWEQAKQEGL